MKIKNQILKVMLTLVLALSIFSCSNDGNNDEIAKLPTFNEIVNADLANYSVLRKGLEVSGLLTAITGNGSYTVFAPNNAAFLAYRSPNFAAGIDNTVLTGTLTAAQANELKRTLMYHVLSSATFSTDLPSKNYIKTYAPYGTSNSITLSAYVDKTNGIEINGGDLMVAGVSNGGAKVTEGDIKASNGVLHKINAVLMLPTLYNQLNANKDLSSYLTNIEADAVTKGFITSPVSNTQLFVPNNEAFTNAASYLSGKTVAEIKNIIKFHITTRSSYDRNATVGIQTDQAQNDGAATATSYLPTTAISNAVVSTKANAIAPAVGNQNFLILRNSFNVTQAIEVLPATSPAKYTEGASLGKLTITNIHTLNGIIHTVNKVLQPAL